MDPQDSAVPSSTVGAEIGSGLLGAGIALGCLLPPLLHLITGPLGPLFGGFVAANRVRPGPRSVAIIAVTVGTVISGFVGTVATIVSNLTGGGRELPSFLEPLVKGPALLAIVGVVWVYGAAMAAGGAVIRGVIAKNKQTSAS